MPYTAYHRSPIRSVLRASTAMAASALLLAAAACGADGAEDQGSTTVTVQLDYQLRGNHGMFHVAQEEGYFEDAGIEVEEITTGSGSPDALRTVGKGQADFGFADLPSLVTARSQGVPVQALAAVNQVSPLGMCTLEDNVQLSSVTDLRGLKIGVHPAGSTYIFYEAMMAANDLGRDQVEEVTVTPPYENYLLEGQVDAVICYVDAEVPLLRQHAGGEGSLSVLLGADAGYDAYGSGLTTNDDMIEQNPETVQAFTDAYLKAFEYVADHPDETAEILAASAPEQSDNAALFQKQLQADIDQTFTSPATEENGLGAMEQQRWQATVDILAEQDALKGQAPPVEEVYDPSFQESYHSGS